MNERGLILIVDDDPHIRETVRFALAKAGFQTAQAEDGRQALDVFQRTGPTLIILDILMPELDGTEVCQAIRRESSVPIIFLTSKDEEVDRIIGLELGGDDYVSKPFSPRELVARVKAVLRRGAAPPPATVPDGSISRGLLRLDLDSHRVYWDQREINLTPTEFALLRTLMNRPGKVYTRDELMNGAYDFDNNVTDRTVDSHIRRVRQKLSPHGPDVVETVHGLGYRLGPCRPSDEVPTGK